MVIHHPISEDKAEFIWFQGSKSKGKHYWVLNDEDIIVKAYPWNFVHIFKITQNKCNNEKKIFSESS